MPFGESDTRAKLIDPAIHARGWAENLIRREESVARRFRKPMRTALKPKIHRAFVNVLILHSDTTLEDHHRRMTTGMISPKSN